ncbi:MAG TPA: TIGR03067 domain-containing protein [Gemmata sp.]|jgi:uncharacterized protein (TIGR03067 family)|nr:TIGR03067 domain-containing protein [Gemmata sp.]
MIRLAFALSLILVAQSSAQQPDPKEKNDQALLQGNWDIIGLDSGGKSESTFNYKGNRFSFSKEKATLREGNFAPVDFTFTLDSTKTPKTIDLTVKGNALHGIYKLDNDALVLCISMGGPRPTEFTTKAGGDCERMIMKRSRWEKYTDKQFGFTVELPGKPEERTREMDTPAGQVTTSLRIVRGVERANYLVSILPLPGKLLEKDQDELMDSLKKAMLAEVSLSTAKSPVETKSTNSNGGRDYTIAADVMGSMDKVEKVTVRIRMSVVGDRLYGLMATGVDDTNTRARPNIVSLFWNSLEQQPAKP